MSEEYEYYSPKEFAALRGVHVQTVYSAIRHQRFPYPIEHIGRAIRIVVPRDIPERKSA